MEKQESLVRRTQAHKLMSDMVNTYWRDVCHAHEDGKLLAFCTFFPFFEMLTAMDTRFVQDENYGAYLLARHAADEAIRRFEEEYDVELCSYMKACNGMVFYRDFPEPAPNTRIPVPDFVVCEPHCGMELKEVQEMQRRFNLPVFWFDLPTTFEDSVNELEDHVFYIKRQIHDFAEFLSDMTHRPFNWERLQQCLANTKRNSQLWQEGVELAKHIPSPLTWFDSILNIFCCNVMQGRPDPQAYLEKFNAEIRERIAQGIGAIRHEKYRILWEFNCMMSKLRFLSELFAKNDANVVIGPWVQHPHRARWQLLDPREPISSLAYDMATLYPNRHRKWKVQFISKLVREYACDGIVVMSPRTCKHLSCGMLVEAEELRERTHLPVLQFEGDTGDEKLWNDAAITTRIEAFLEEVANRKERRGYLASYHSSSD